MGLTGQITSNALGKPLPDKPGVRTRKVMLSPGRFAYHAPGTTSVARMRKAMKNWPKRKVRGEDDARIGVTKPTKAARRKDQRAANKRANESRKINRQQAAHKRRARQERSKRIAHAHKASHK